MHAHIRVIQGLILDFPESTPYSHTIKLKLSIKLPHNWCESRYLQQYCQLPDIEDICRDYLFLMHIIQECSSGAVLNSLSIRYELRSN